MANGTQAPPPSWEGGDDSSLLAREAEMGCTSRDVRLPPPPLDAWTGDRETDRRDRQEGQMQRGDG